MAYRFTHTPSVPQEEQLFFQSLRKEFPQLSASSSFTYLDSAATTLKPQCVIDSLCHFYAHEYATVNRGLYKTAREASARYEAVRKQIQQFLSASSEEEIIFTRGTTDSLNLLAELLARSLLTSRSKIVLSQMEHHSNIVPWQMAKERTGAEIFTIPLTSEDTLDMNALEEILSQGDVTIVSLCHMSNVLGTMNPIRTIADLCHRYGALLSVDGAQSVPHMLSNVQEMDCDFLSFSSHKLYGPTGVGVLWGKKKLLEQLAPTRGGGGMIDTVTFAKTTYGPLPSRFEAGTPAIAEVIGLGTAISFLQRIGLERIAAWENALSSYLSASLASIPHVRLIGHAPSRGPIQSIAFTNAHPLDVATFLDMKDIAVRSGHMCCQPLLLSLQTSSLMRVSFGLYNSFDDCNRFLNGLEKILRLIGR